MYLRILGTVTNRKSNRTTTRSGGFLGVNDSVRPPQKRNEETCFPYCFPVCAQRKHLLRKQFLVSEKQKIFLIFFRYILFPRR